MKTRPFIVCMISFWCSLGCSPDKPLSPLSNKEISDSSQIFLGDEQLFLRKPQPVDVDYVLSNEADISIGIASDVPGAHIQNDEKQFIPASITKILTTASALSELGPEFKFKTRIGFDLLRPGQATNLTIAADGDPTLGTTLGHGGSSANKATQMDDLVKALKSRGVTSILGSITFVSEDTRLDSGIYADGIETEDLRECYGAMAGSFNFRSNCAHVRVNAKSGFSWANMGAGEFLKMSLETLVGDRTSLSLEPALSSDRTLEGFVLRGTFLEKTPKTLQFQLPVANAVGWYSRELIKKMKASGIDVRSSAIQISKTSAEKAAARAFLERQSASVITVESPPLSLIVEATNKSSDNFLADSLFKTMGLRHASPRENLSIVSRKSIHDFLGQWLRADGRSSWTGDFVFLEGAGLSLNNRATPRAFLSVLRQISKSPIFPQLWNSLPIAGVDGTLADRMKNTSAAGKVRGKTGTLKGSYQLVGYIPKVTGLNTEYIPFVILTSTTAKNRNAVKRFQDAVVVKMYDAAQ